MATTHNNMAVRRAALPEILFVEDLALAIDCSPATARRIMLSGACGAVGRLGRRLYVLRSTLIDSLATRSATSDVSGFESKDGGLRLVESAEVTRG